MEKELERNAEKIYSPVSDFVRVVHVSKKAVYDAIRKNELPHLKFGKKILVNIPECIEVLRQPAAQK